MTASWMVPSSWLLTDFEQVKENNSHLADFEQVKIFNSHFADFEQVKEINSHLLTLNKSKISLTKLL